MPLNAHLIESYAQKPIKYYTFNQTEELIQGSWYEGERGFICKPSAGRIYPDEYLIVDILEKYLQQLQDPRARDKIIFIKEPWIGNTGQRDGKTNVNIGEQILSSVDDQLAKNSKPERLIVVPFLFHNHHPGVCIDLKNKVAIYIDPFGSPPYQDVIDLQRLQQELVKKGFQFKVVNVEQQQRGIDASSCGPILTDSLRALIDNFLTEGCIIGVRFIAAKKELATSRLVQMNLRNPKLTQEASQELEVTVDEISLADVSLWKCFFREQRFKNQRQIELITSVIQKQKEYIQKMVSQSNHKGMDFELLNTIIAFQRNITNAILDKNLDNLDALIESWIQQNDIHYHTPLNNNLASIMPFNFVSIKKTPHASRKDFTHIITFASNTNRDTCLRIINDSRANTELKQKEASHPLQLSLSSRDFRTLESSELLGQTIRELQREFRNSIQFVNDNPQLRPNNPNKIKLLEKFNNIISEVDKALSGRVHYDRFALCKVLEFNLLLFLAFYPGSNQNILLEVHPNTIPTSLTTLEDFYHNHLNVLPGRRPSGLGKIFSIIGMIIGLAAVIVDIVVIPPVAVGGLLIGIGLWSYSRSKGTGLHKEQTELIDEVNIQLPTNS